jgi:hypothetical protein
LYGCFVGDDGIIPVRHSAHHRRDTRHGLGLQRSRRLRDPLSDKARGLI